jgi:hypothetical protein
VTSRESRQRLRSEDRDLGLSSVPEPGFAHSELYGFQSIQTALLQAESAVDRIVKIL